MRRPRILAVIQAGGKGGRMDVLSRETPKPLLPFAGTHRLIDFPLSNLQNSGVTEVWLSVQYLGQQLADALDNGKVWDLDRQHGGFKVLVPDQGSGAPVDEGFASGNAEELLKIRHLIQQHAADVLIVLSADHVYRIDFDAVVTEHLSRGAECTVVTTTIGVADASNHAAVQSDEAGRVIDFAYKPDDPATGTVATEIFLYEPTVLIEVLEELHRDNATKVTEFEALGDFGDLLLPTLVERGRVYASHLEGYWRDLGRPETYFAAHAELLATDIGLFSDLGWPIRTEPCPRPAARVADGATVSDSLLSPGCRVAGTVTRSVLGPGVRVEPGAAVVDSVLFTDVVVRAGARLDHVIADVRSEIGSGARVGEAASGTVTTDDLVLIGPDAVVAQDAVLSAGARLEPGTTG